MIFRRVRVHFTAAALAVALLSGATEAQGAKFDITYDDTDDGEIGGAIVGTGSFSFDGPAVPGEFPLDTLTNLRFSAVVGGVVFDTADISTDLAMSNLLIFEQSGQTIATFTGSGGIASNGSFDLVATGDQVQVLTHEPGPAGAPCCGGADDARLFASNPNSASLIFGNYQMVIVPEPTAAALTLTGLVLATIRSRHQG